MYRCRRPLSPRSTQLANRTYRRVDRSGTAVEGRPALGAPASAGNRAIRRAIADAQRTITEGATTYDTLAAALAAVGPRLGSLDPLRVRAVLSQFNHDNRTFDSAAALDAAVTSAVAGMAGENVAVAWADERLEATTSVGSTTYTFTMSYKHLGDTYGRGDRGTGAANMASDEGNTILTLGDGAVMARFFGLVRAVRTAVLEPAAAHPHRLAPGTSQSFGGTNWVTEGTTAVHVYPTDGGDTVNLTNAEYRALVAFAAWRRSPTTVSRGELLANEATLRASGGKITLVTGVPNVPTLVAMARVDQRIDFITAEAGRIDAGFAAERARIATARSEIGSRQWLKSLQQRVAQTALDKATQVESDQAAIVDPLALSTLPARATAGAVELDEAERALRAADDALRALMAAAASLVTNFRGAVSEDVPDADDDEGGLLGAGF